MVDTLLIEVGPTVYVGATQQFYRYSDGPSSVDYRPGLIRANDTDRLTVRITALFDGLPVPTT
jgi:hypothetical protein